jgi:hypothetical protein
MRAILPIGAIAIGLLLVVVGLQDPSYDPMTQSYRWSTRLADPIFVVIGAILMLGGIGYLVWTGIKRREAAKPVSDIGGPGGGTRRPL